MEKCGVTFLTVHGRTPTQKIGDPSNAEFLSEIKKSISVPIIANGDVKSLSGANELYEKINCDGIMAARGILSNPAMFCGAELTPIDCIQTWINLMAMAGDSVTFQCLHHHLTFMMEKRMRRRLRFIFNNLTQKQQVFDFLAEHLGIVPELQSTFDHCDEILCQYDAGKHAERQRIAAEQAKSLLDAYSSEATQGQYYLDYMMETNIFDDDTT